MATNNQQQEKFIFNILLMGITYITFGKPILEFLGISKGKGTKDYLSESQDPNSVFGVSYWRNFFYVKGSPANGRKPITQSMIDKAKQAAKIMVNAFGYITDDEDEVIQAIQLCNSKAMVSLMSYFITNNYQTSLLGLLKYGKNSTPQNGLSESEMENIIAMVRRLPNT